MVYGKVWGSWHQEPARSIPAQDSLGTARARRTVSRKSASASGADDESPASPKETDGFARATLPHKCFACVPPRAGPWRQGMPLSGAPTPLNPMIQICENVSSLWRWEGREFPKSLPSGGGWQESGPPRMPPVTRVALSGRMAPKRDQRVNMLSVPPQKEKGPAGGKTRPGPAKHFVSTIRPLPKKVKRR
jgi:hypothetical protein